MCLYYKYNLLVCYIMMFKFIVMEIYITCIRQYKINALEYVFVLILQTQFTSMLYYADCVYSNGNI